MAKTREHDKALQEALRERELKIAEEHAPVGHEATLHAIASDRRERWGKLLAERMELGPITEWANRMATRYGATVTVWRTKGLDWITALYIVRYGEAESFWPPQLTLDDLTRAKQWERGEGWPAYVTRDDT